jgi:hypothetical protein
VHFIAVEVDDSKQQIAEASRKFSSRFWETSSHLKKAWRGRVRDRPVEKASFFEGQGDCGPEGQACYCQDQAQCESSDEHDHSCNFQRTKNAFKQHNFEKSCASFS